MVKSLNDMLHRLAQVLEIEQQSGPVQIFAGQGHADLIVVAVGLLALALVIAQVVACSKRIFNRDFEHDPFPDRDPKGACFTNLLYSRMAGSQPS